MYAILREGTKLILNSASGAADANFESNIRMNNTIISMRIIGQLFSWRIGQAQTIEGAKITSTNTDGLYSILDATINDPILARESADIGVEIEPEPTYLISKDSNNRIEMDPNTGEVQSASGGTLGCRKGPNPAKSLAHPAIIDWALTEYLICAALKVKGYNATLYNEFDDTLGMKILKSASQKFEPFKFLNMFQNVIASSTGSMNYIFATTDENPSKPIIMQHYNRVFILKDNTPNTVHLYAANARQITPAQTKKRKDSNERAQQHDATAVSVLTAHGVDIHGLPKTKEAIVKKVTNIDDRWYMYIQNKDLHALTDEEINFIIDNIDYDKYLQLLRDGFEKNWRNQMPKWYIAYWNQSTSAEPIDDTIVDHNQTNVDTSTDEEPVSDQQMDTIVPEMESNETIVETTSDTSMIEPTVVAPVIMPAIGAGYCFEVDAIKTELLSTLNSCLDLAKTLPTASGISDYPHDYSDNICKAILTTIDTI